MNTWFTVRSRRSFKNEEKTSFLAWTTTPWTLISNAGLAVHPKEEYVKVKYNDEFLYLAKALLHILDDEYEIVENFVGADLEYKEYEPLFRYIEPNEKAWFVCLADYVSMTDGTGIVHTAPAFGQDDFEIGKKYGLPVINLVNASGEFIPEVTDWAGVFVKTADKEIIRNLKDRGLLYKREQISHNYPHCWRCKSPLIYYARSSWYIRTSMYKEEMQKESANTNWFPSFVGEKRFGEWLENNVDWALSRDRFWGTPLNIWVSEDGKEKYCIGSVEELIRLGQMEDGSAVPEDIDLHRPHVDNIVIKSSRINCCIILKLRVKSY